MVFVWKANQRLKTPEQVAREVHEVSLTRGLDELATVLALMCIRQESDFWCPWNAKDPSSKNYAYDSESNDGRSVGYFQQQNGRAGDTLPEGDRDNWWGPMRSRMDLKSSANLFLERLSDDYHQAANDPYKAAVFIDRVQGSYWNGDANHPGYYGKHWSFCWDLLRRALNQGSPVTPTPPPPTYGLPRGTNIQYGKPGFPQWVYDVAKHFGLKASTYPGHQESNRNEAGFAPNPQGLNRGIDWTGPVNKMQAFADYCMANRAVLEQVIWQNPNTGQKAGVAGGRDVTHSSYYAADYGGHRDHVHTRQSRPIPLPGGQPAPTPTVPAVPRPQFIERPMFGKGASKRSRPPINFFIHTQEGSWEATAEDLAAYCQGQNGVSYHYTIRDGIVYDVVDTDLYSWSVLDANVFSINLCFAGSSVSQTRQQWLDRYGRDIDIAAYLAVQDARKYGFSTEVLVPDWARSGKDVYAGGPRPGISDHNYVTRELGIGSHTDVGRNFPWDVFVASVNKYAANPTVGDDMALVPQDQWDRALRAIERMERELTQDHPSRSPFRHLGEGRIDTWCGIDLNNDAHGHVSRVIMQARLGHPESLALLREVASATEEPQKYPDRQEDALLAQAVLATLQEEGVDATPTRSVSAPSPVISYSPDSQEVAALRAENARLVAEVAELRVQAAHVSAGTSTAVVPVEQGTSWGGTAGRVIDSVEDWTELLMSMNAEQRKALSAGLKALELPITSNGSK